MERVSTLYRISNKQVKIFELQESGYLLRFCLCSLRLCPLPSSSLHRSPADGCGSDRDRGGGTLLRWQDSTCCPTPQPILCLGTSSWFKVFTLRLVLFFRRVLRTYYIACIFLSPHPNRVTAINCKICGFRETEALGFHLKGHMFCGICRIVYL